MRRRLGFRPVSLGWYPPPGTSPNLPLLLQRVGSHGSGLSRIKADHARAVSKEVTLTRLTNRCRLSIHREGVVGSGSGLSGIKEVVATLGRVSDGRRCQRLID